MVRVDKIVILIAENLNEFQSNLIEIIDKYFGFSKILVDTGVQVCNMDNSQKWDIADKIFFAI